MACRYEDEYQLEDLDVTYSDYVKPLLVPAFRATWEELGDSAERADEYGLGAKDSLQEAVEAVLGTLGMQVRGLGLLRVGVEWLHGPSGGFLYTHWATAGW